jgi:hypothetical protein
MPVGGGRRGDGAARVREFRCDERCRYAVALERRVPPRPPPNDPPAPPPLPRRAADAGDAQVKRSGGAGARRSD